MNMFLELLKQLNEKEAKRTTAEMNEMLQDAEYYKKEEQRLEKFIEVLKIKILETIDMIDESIATKQMLLVLLSKTIEEELSSYTMASLIGLALFDGGK